MLFALLLAFQPHHTIDYRVELYNYDHTDLIWSSQIRAFHKTTHPPWGIDALHIANLIRLPPAFFTTCKKKLGVGIENEATCIHTDIEVETSVSYVGVNMKV